MVMSHGKEKDNKFENFMNLIKMDDEEFKKMLFTVDNKLFKMKDEDERTILHWCASTNSCRKLAICLMADFDINQTDDDGWSALHVAVSHSNIDIIKILIDHSIDTELKTKSRGYVAFHLATIKGNVEIMKLLIESGCDTKVEDNYKLNSLHLAILNGVLDAIEFLIEKNFNLECLRTNVGKNILKELVDAEQIHTLNFLNAKVPGFKNLIHIE